jgi:hypothetical protein
MSHIALTLYGRLMVKLQKVAHKETDSILENQPPDIRERMAGVRILFEDRPSRTVLTKGVLPEALSFADKDAKTITIFLINLHDVYAGEPSAFRKELRKVLVGEISDWVGREGA